MAKLHHSTLRSAVSKYLEFKDLPNDELVAKISEDEKGFAEDEINQIIESMQDDGNAGAKVKNKKKGEYSIIQSCRDKDNFDKVYNVGEDVSHWDQERIENAIKIGVVE